MQKSIGCIVIAAVLYVFVIQLHLLTSMFPLQCESLMKRLVVSEEKYAACEQEIDKQREIVNQLKETLQTTSRYANHLWYNVWYEIKLSA